MAAAGLNTLKRNLYTALDGPGPGGKITLSSRRRDGGDNTSRRSE